MALAPCASGANIGSSVLLGVVMATRRDGVYVYATWVAKQLGGDACRWKLWFRAQHQYNKRPSDFDLATWAAEHDAMVQETAESLRAGGYEVFLEEQNTFSLRNKQDVVFAGRPDIVAVKNGHALVVDCKTGRARHSDTMQVMLYMLVLPHTHMRCKGVELRGEVRYKHTDPVPIPADGIHDEFRQMFRDLMSLASGNEEPPKHPSFGECSFCDITAADCPERVDEEQIEVETDLY